MLLFVCTSRYTGGQWIPTCKTKNIDRIRVPLPLAGEVLSGSGENSSFDDMSDGASTQRFTECVPVAL